MKKGKCIPIILSILIVLLSGCAPEAGTIPTHEEVVKQVHRKVSLQEASQYCVDHGGKMEQWKNEDTSLSTFCVLPEGYGCDPLQFADGSCGRELN